MNSYFRYYLLYKVFRFDKPAIEYKENFQSWNMKGKHIAFQEKYE